MPVSGSKIEISERIVTYLKTGEKNKPIRQVQLSAKRETQEKALSLDTIIRENHRCSQVVREFFKMVIPAFHFTTHIQNYFKNHPGKTYRDAVNEWNEEAQRKKDPFYKKKIPHQFEYNQFIRDFYADPQNKGKSHSEAREAWNRIKKLPGSNTYMPTSLVFILFVLFNSYSVYLIQSHSA